MANLPGFIAGIAAIPTAAGHITTDLDLMAPPAWPPAGSAVSIGAAGAYVSQLPVSQQANVITGGHLRGFAADYYDRVHVVPSRIDFGNVINDQTQQIEVWNAYSTAQLLSSVDAAGAGDLTLTEPAPAPTTFAPRESRIYGLEAQVTGAPVIDASYRFNFPAEAPELLAVGNRIAVWPFAPNWRSPVIERLIWKTDVLEAYDGTEQRRALRDAPRRQFEFAVLAAGQPRQQFDAMLFGWQGRRFLLPVFTDREIVQADIPAGATTISVETAGRDYTAGRYAVLMQGTLDPEVVQIDSVAADHIVLAYGVQRQWPAGTSILPGRIARLQPAQAVGAITSVIDDLVVLFDVDDNDAAAASDSADSYRGDPVLTQQPNWRDDIDIEYARRMQRLDNQSGVVWTDDERGRPYVGYDYLWTRFGRQAISDLRGWLHARQGRLKAIWVPTWQDDLTLITGVLAAESSLFVARVEYGRFLDGAPGRRDIVIRLTDGSRIYRRIVGGTQIDAATDRIDLDATMGRDITLSDVVSISYMQRMRLESDTIELAWFSGDLVECRHRLVGDIA